MTQELDPTITPAGAGTSRILVVDDDQTICSVCAMALTQAGYAVTTAIEAPEGLRLLRTEGPFDLLLADIHMPGISGLALAETARELDPAIAVVIMTGHTSMDTLHQAVRQGVADFLSKPFELEELRLAVGQALHKRQLMQERVRLRALEQLLASSEAVNGILDRADLCQVILARARGHVPCAAGFLILADSDEGAETFAEPAGATLLPAGRAAADEAMRTNRPLVVAAGPLCDAKSEPVARGLAVPLRAQGEVAGVLLLCDDGEAIGKPGTIDIVTLLANQAGTALRNAQLYGELQGAYQRLRELDRLKSEFIAIASHELRSPLSIVLGYSKMLRDRGDGDQREYAQRALDGAEQIKAIVDTMVRLRDYDISRAYVTLETCVIDELARQAVERLSGLAAEKGLRIELELPEPPVRLRVDREKVLLVLGSLIDNAIKFTPSGGEVRVDAAIWPHEQLAQEADGVAPNPTLRQLAEPPPAAWAVVRVADSGIGIAREQQSRIFERFYQVASSLTRGHGGPGLGLALVSDLTHLQGGVVWVNSEPGAGSTFCFALPYAAVP
jgi:signal transduction histidine kinase/CheY-like chemotaxis protein